MESSHGNKYVVAGRIVHRPQIVEWHFFDPRHIEVDEPVLDVQGRVHSKRQLLQVLREPNTPAQLGIPASPLAGRYHPHQMTELTGRFKRRRFVE